MNSSIVSTESFEAGVEDVLAEQDGSGGRFSEGVWELDDDIGTSDSVALGPTGGDGNSRPGVLSSRERFEKDEAISFLIRLRVAICKSVVAKCSSVEQNISQ